MTALQKASPSLIDLSTGKRIKDISVGAGPNGVTVDRFGLKGYVVNMRSDSVSVLDILGQKIVHEIPVGRAPAFAKRTLDAKLLAVTNLRSASVSIVDTETYAIVAELQVGVPELNDAYPHWVLATLLESLLRPTTWLT
jgi:YVTN family beta-propeller protein